MLINLRTAVANGSLPDAIGLAVEAAEVVENATGSPVGVWSALYGRPLGSIAWSSQAESFVELEARNQKLAEDSSFAGLAERAQALFITGSWEDTISNVVHSAGELGRAEFVSALTAVAVADKAAEAVAFGVDISDYVNSKTGGTVAFCTDLFSDVGRMTWIATYDSAEALDAAQQLAADPGYLERTSKVGDIFVAGTGSSVLSRRIN